MIILDTNVLSELTRLEPNPKVVAWLNSWPAQEVATTAVNAAELWYGVAKLPDGRRKTELALAIDGLVNQELRDQVLAFDIHAAAQFAMIAADRRRRGRPIDPADGQIAAICRALDATLATRNTKDFEGTGIDLVDPWDAA